MKVSLGFEKILIWHEWSLKMRLSENKKYIVLINEMKMDEKQNKVDQNRLLAFCFWKIKKKIKGKIKTVPNHDTFGTSTLTLQTDLIINLTCFNLEYKKASQVILLASVWDKLTLNLFCFTFSYLVIKQCFGYILIFLFKSLSFFVNFHFLLGFLPYRSLLSDTCTSFDYFVNVYVKWLC